MKTSSNSSDYCPFTIAHCLLLLPNVVHHIRIIILVLLVLTLEQVGVEIYQSGN
jgi:hypothetical protein